MEVPWADEVWERVMDDDLRVVDAPSTGAPPDPAADTAPGADGTDAIDLRTGGAGEVDTGEGDVEPPAKPRRWLRRTGIAALVLLLLSLGGLQFQVAQVQDQTEQAERAQRQAELDEDAARARLASVGDRVRIAEADQEAATAELARARADMTAQGFEESALSQVQAATADKVTDLRAGVKKVGKDIAEQNRLRPAAAACLFDMLRALGRVDNGARGGQASEACKTVAAASGPA